MLSWADYVPGVSQAKSFIQEKTGDKKGAAKTKDNFMEAYANILDVNKVVTSCKAHYCSEKTSKLSRPAWMSKVPDSKYITEITIPGTHDSGCRKGGEFGKCQSWKIPEQLKAGIRFFDIRCKNVKNQFHIYHGILDCKLSFKELTAACEFFLLENPTEFILMRIKEEGASEDATKSFNDVYKKSTRNAIFFVKTTKEVTVDQVRGKIVILKDFKGAGNGHEIDYMSSVTQDSYSPPSIEFKIKKIQKHHVKAKPLPDKFHINYLTACTASENLWPRKFASKCNKHALTMLTNGSNPFNFAGIVVMDFPGEELIKTIIKVNKFPKIKTDAIIGTAVDTIDAGTPDVDTPDTADTPGTLDADKGMF